MTSIIGWELYRSFLGVLKEGSLSGASRALGVAQPTVGRHITALEQSLGLVLFTRSPSGLMPTDAALSLRGHAEAMESTAAALERAAASEKSGIRGVVRITASEIIGAEVLPVVIAELRENYPELNIELVLSNRVQDLLHREADIAVRMTQPRQEQLIARYIGKIELGLHATADYLLRHGTPVTVDELAQHTLIGFDQITPFIRDALNAMPQFDHKNLSVRTDSDLTQLALIRAGVGIGFCQIPLAQKTPILTRILPDAFSLPLDTWITMHEDLRNSPRCRVAFDALVKGMQNHIHSTDAE